MTQEQFEAAALQALTAGDHPIFNALREQLAAASVENREFSETGFFTDFAVPKTAPSVAPKTLHIGDVQFTLRGADTPADAIIHVDNGYLRTLEGYVYGGRWPEDPTIQSVGYYGAKQFPAVSPALFKSRDLQAALEQ